MLDNKSRNFKFDAVQFHSHILKDKKEDKKTFLIKGECTYKHLETYRGFKDVLEVTILTVSTEKGKEDKEKRRIKEIYHFAKGIGQIEFFNKSGYFSVQIKELKEE